MLDTTLHYNDNFVFASHSSTVLFLKFPCMPLVSSSGLHPFTSFSPSILLYFLNAGHCIIEWSGKKNPS